MKLATIFTDGMVIQKGQPIKVFGEGSGEGSVSFLGQGVSFCSNEDSFCVTLEPCDEYGGPYEMEVTLNGERVVLRDVYVGEVWLCGGQSNMEMPLFRVDYGIDEADNSTNENIRFFTVPRRLRRDEPNYGWHFIRSYSVDTPWEKCTPETAARFSAIGFYVAKELQKKLGCVVGMISCNWGGVRMESFTGRKWIESDPSLAHIVKEWDEKVARLDIDEHNKKLKAADESFKHIYDTVGDGEIERVRELGVRPLAGGPDGRMLLPPFPEGPNTPNALSCLYDSMYARIIPYGIKGIVWYQGESNSRYEYLEKYLAYMRCMRDSFENPDLPIYAIELATFAFLWDYEGEQAADGRFVTGENWAFRREQQQMATEIAPNNYLVTSMELGDLYDIHPLQKKLLSHRAVMKILKHSYGFDIYADQPVFRKATFEGEKVILEFDNADGLRIGWGGNESLKMYVSDESRCLKRAKVKLDGNKLILHSDEVKKPILARYAFDDYYCGKHVYNKAGLPLSPFRTDNFD